MDTRCQPCAAEQSLSSGVGWQRRIQSDEQRLQCWPGFDAAGFRRRLRHLQILQMTSGSMQLLVDVEIASVAAAAGLSAPRLGRRPLSTVFNRYPGDASHGRLV